jgi:ubiquinone/menaquinone biosynthesis C-methylase UbiE
MIKEEDVLRFLKDRFTGVSPDNDGIRKRYENHVKTEHSKPLLESVLTHLSKKSKILDIGSGWGSFVYLLNEKGYEASGVEVQDFMVDYARQRLMDLGNLKTKTETVYLKASALDLPFSDSHFDIVTLWDVLEHIEDYEKVLHEAIRVLKPKGKIFIKNVNYASCFMEPHYRVPWLPFLPKKIAVKYLQLLGRDPSYIQNGIFYISNSNILRVLKNKNLHITTLQIEKILSSMPQIRSPMKRLIYNISAFFRAKYILVLILKAIQKNPFSSSVDIMAVKK